MPSLEEIMAAGMARHRDAQAAHIRGVGNDVVLFDRVTGEQRQVKARYQPGDDPNKAKARYQFPPGTALDAYEPGDSFLDTTITGKDPSGAVFILSHKKNETGAGAAVLVIAHVLGPDFFNSFAEIQTGVDAPDLTGTGVETEYNTPDAYSKFPCRAEPAARPTEGVEGASVVDLSRWTIYAPLRTEIAADQRIIVDGMVFDVTGTSEGATDAPVLTLQATLLGRLE